MRIAIDLTPVLLGGANGGAKIMTLELINSMSKIAPSDHFILLASTDNIEELSAMKRNNISVINASEISQLKVNISYAKKGYRFILKLFFGFFKIMLPDYIKEKLKNSYKIIKSKSQVSSFADLLFCPFTAPFYRTLGIPIVSVIYDLQFRYYPNFFSPQENLERQKHFFEACKWSNKLICISDFVKQTVIEKGDIIPDKVKTIYIRLAHRLPSLNKVQLPNNILNQHGLSKDCFLLYPANFWSHKNHKMLFVAFNMYRSKFPRSQLKLVCSGEESSSKNFLIKAIKEMGLEEWIILPGYLSDNDFSFLVENSRAIIFPSLYEGFGMPVLEAMAHGKPVLCSNLTSLPEVAGNAALLFDPRKPDEIVNAIYRIESDTLLVDKLVKLGHDRVNEFGNEIDMAKEYLQVFQEVIQKSNR